MFRQQVKIARYFRNAFSDANKPIDRIAPHGSVREPAHRLRRDSGWPVEWICRILVGT
jgi:hypothetical protein